jgi:hypothetical protein
MAKKVSKNQRTNRGAGAAAKAEFRRNSLDSALRPLGEPIRVAKQ